MGISAPVLSFTVALVSCLVVDIGASIGMDCGGGCCDWEIILEDNLYIVGRRG